MMMPYENNGHLTAAQLNFNTKLSQCRVRVENAFARAKGKWRRLKFLYARNQAYVVDHITASFVLHNFQILHGEEMLDVSIVNVTKFCISFIFHCLLLVTEIICLQGEELGRAIGANEVLGVVNGDEAEEVEPVEPEHPLLDAARARGIEKRAFLTDHVLPALAHD